jgi:beta-galactosidase
MRTKNLSFLIVAFFMLSVSVQGQVREKINMDNGWKFHFGDASDPSKDFNYGIVNIFSKTAKAEGTAIDRKFNDSAWNNVQIPHDWAVELPFVQSSNFDVMAHGYKPVGALFPQTSIGWYRKNFSIALADSGKRFSITFDGIFRDAEIWLNGFYLGNNKSGYTGVSYDITDYIDFHKQNILVVRVDASQYEGWFYEGAGIYRHVWLNKFNNIHIPDDGIFAYSNVKQGVADVVVETSIENQDLTSSNCSVQSLITDRDGKIVAISKEIPVALAINGKNKITQKLVVKQPQLWDLDNPYLYKLKIVLRENKSVIDNRTLRFGIRTITIDAVNGVTLNGKNIKIQGVNCHQDHAGVGSALPDYLQYYRIRLLKELGANAYRTSHHAPTPELLDACDSLGMLVLDETRLLNSSPEYIGQFERIILRDRNHPSVFLWSIANEEGYAQQTSNGKRIALTMVAKQKELDPTRMATYAADLANVFKGVNEVIPVRGFNYRVSGIIPYHNDHPNQPVIGTEMGSTVTSRGIYVKDSIKGYVPDQDITAPWWANRAEEWWPLAATNKWMAGGFVWTGLDYRGEPIPYEWPNINSHFGIMDVCGFPKNIYYYYQSWWTNKDVLHISPHWNWKGKEGQPVEVWVNTNADNVELFLNGKSLGKKDMPRNSHLNWTVPFEAGELKAIAVKNGRTIISSVETTDEPSEVVVTPYKTTMTADGKDATVLNISVVDKKGREVPDAQNLITFQITGDAKIIGVGNGDPSSHEPDKCLNGIWQRKLFNGKCQVILQSGKTRSNVKFEAKTEGLYPGSTEIHIIELAKPGISTGKVNIKGSAPRTRMLGADVSFLPQLEERGMKFSDKGAEKDALEILKDHGFNYIRLRIFNNPAQPKGYAPDKGFCDLEHTKQMATRIKKAGLKFLLDFHYSDYWADPQQQYKPLAWQDLKFDDLEKALKEYTRSVINALKEQGTTPDMVQIGNEINHGMAWPDGHINNPDNLARLIKAGIEGVKEADPSVNIMLHIALGGQNDESVSWLDEMFSRGVDCDVIGLSYYPKWHGTLSDLDYNLNDLIKRYHKDVAVVEYSQLKREVNDIAFNLPDNKGLGTCIWEPLNTWEAVFNKDGKSNDWLNLYDKIKDLYLK